MTLSSGRTRVLVVPEKPSVDLESVVTRAQLDAAELLILNLGVTPTEPQRILVRHALQLAAEKSVAVEARLVQDVAEAREYTRYAREITVAGKPSVQVELEAALMPDHPGIPGVALWRDPRKPGSSISPGTDGPPGSSNSPSTRASPGTESGRVPGGPPDPPGPTPGPSGPRRWPSSASKPAFASTWGQRPASARPTPCWARGSAGAAVAPTSSSATSRPTAVRSPPRC